MAWADAAAAAAHLRPPEPDRHGPPTRLSPRGHGCDRPANRALGIAPGEVVAFSNRIRWFDQDPRRIRRRSWRAVYGRDSRYDAG